MNEIVRNLENFVAGALRGDDKVLIPRQLETVRKILDFLKAGYTEGHVVNPTGIGKTVVFSKLLEAILQGTDLRGLVIGPTKIILHQNRWKLDVFGSIQAGAYYGNEKDLSKQMTVTTYHSLRTAFKSGAIKPNDYDIIILDEAHRALGETTLAAIESFERAVKIGFTATPEFHEEKTVADLLPFTIDEMSVREAIDASLLSGLKVFVINTGVAASSLERQGRDYEEWILEKVINVPARNRFIAKLCKDKRFENKRTVVYAAGRKHAQDLVSAFQSENLVAEYIDGETPEDEREDIFARFKDGSLPILCNAKVLIEGFDEPEAEICLNAAPTLSKVVAEQRGGRVLRRSRTKDRKIGYVVEILDDFGQSDNTPVLFSEIAGAAEILPPEMREEEAKRKPKKTKRKRKKTATQTQPRNPRKKKIVEDPSVIMDLTNENKRQRFTKMFEFAPRGWVYARRLAHELHTKESMIRGLAESYHNEHEDWFKRFLTPTDILVQHYHPKLANIIRRLLDPTLEHRMTAEEYAERIAITADRAVKILDAADEQAKDKAKRFGDVAFYSAKELEAIILTEQQKAKQAENNLLEEAEELFWQDDDRTPEQCESDYWNCFDERFKEDIGDESEQSDEFPGNPDAIPDELLVPFDDDRHIASTYDESYKKNRYLEKTVREWLRLLPEHYEKVIVETYFEDKEIKDIAESLNLHRATITNRENRALQLLRSARWLTFMWKAGYIDTEQVNGVCRPSRGEIMALGRDTNRTLDVLWLEFCRSKSYI